MDSRRLLQRICRRHGLAYDEATRLLPILRRAIRSPAEVRDRLLLVIERSLARRSAATARHAPDAVFRDLDDELLVSVAQVLHVWKPTGRGFGTRDLPPDLYPEDDVGGE